MQRLTIKRGDTGFGIKATLSNTQGCVDLTDASVLFLFDKFEIPSEVIDAENGEVIVFFERTHTEDAGFYNAEFEVQFPDGRVETFPSNGYLKIHITSDLGGIS